MTGGLKKFSSPALNTAEVYDPVADTFTALTAKMTTARNQHAATLLPNGLVLITGGSPDENGDGLDTAEVYDPTANKFTALTATLTTPRGGRTATLLPNGQVLLTGGFSNDGSLNTAEVYDPTDQTFTALATTMTTARSGHTATLLPDGQVLLTGGSSNHTTFNSAEVYDPVHNTFTALTATMTTARAGHTATLLPDNQVLLTGGLIWGTSTFTVLKTAEVYDPVANTFTALNATMTTARAFHRAALLPNDLVLITGGGYGKSTSSVTILDTAEVYDP
ncbi:Kelch repeat-containing protein [Candidatus Binatus soli]|uniref:Kelch repeat-containing protein n=1 Tax=Candidatus Binatus soli TaxID=1953413 RepID=UPI003D13D347